MLSTACQGDHPSVGERETRFKSYILCYSSPTVWMDLNLKRDKKKISSKHLDDNTASNSVYPFSSDSIMQCVETYNILLRKELMIF